MLIQTLMMLARTGDFTIAVRAIGTDKSALSLVFVPVPREGQEPALAQPICLTGTVEELEAGFASALGQYVEARASLADQVAATLTILEGAKNASATKAADALKGKAKSLAKPAAHQSALAAPTAPDGDQEESDAAEEIDEDELPDTATANVIAPSATIPVAANAGLGNLFDS
jgi:PRTRC genetic system protein E